MKPAAVPVIRYDEQRAAHAFQAHCALLLLEQINPKLRDNPAWTVLRQDAYENFELAFVGAQ